MRKSFCILVAAGALVLAAHPAAAQYPARPVRMVLTFPAGGPLDIVTRAIALPLAQALGQPVVVENKPGGDGLIAADAVAKSAPNGYTLFLASSALASVPALHKSPPFDPLADFTPVTSVGSFSFFVFVHASVPANSLAELVDYARAHPGKMTYGTASTTAMLASAQLLSMAKVAMVHVPYKGDPPAFSDFTNGRVQMMIGAPLFWLPQVKAGKLRALGTLLTRRSSLLPEVPTMAEAGFPGISFVPWAALLGPAGMPKEIVERLNRDVRAVLQRQEVGEQLDKLAFQTSGSTPEELAAYLREQIEVWRNTARDAGIVPR
ncbi:MAG: tripartite tricarboxylate transporter substrate binding protein [Betaproteobacteria bacterium]|nr:tripartite tricarboxylate transporter substrate binding protein [Betaproteobacteria bacterium]